MKYDPHARLSSGVEFLGLSTRQVQVARLRIDGATVPEVAQHLRIGVGTVKTHIRRMNRKLGIHSRIELAACAHDALEQDERKR